MTSPFEQMSDAVDWATIKRFSGPWANLLHIPVISQGPAKSSSSTLGKTRIPRFTKAPYQGKAKFQIIFPFPQNRFNKVHPSNLPLKNMPGELRYRSNNIFLDKLFELFPVNNTQPLKFYASSSELFFIVFGIRNQRV
jgi:hypothetical protein